MVELEMRKCCRDPAGSLILGQEAGNGLARIADAVQTDCSISLSFVVVVVVVVVVNYYEERKKKILDGPKYPAGTPVTSNEQESVSRLDRLRSRISH